MAIDIKDALYHFGMITGQVTNDELGNIFANFCIGSNILIFKTCISLTDKIHKLKPILYPKVYNLRSFYIHK
jgi:hypothetical protein